MIDQRFSREAFESLRSPVERQLLAHQLADELRAYVARACDPAVALGAALARLRLIGHHLYTVGDTPDGAIVYGGHPTGDESPTGLEIEVTDDGVDVRYRNV